MPGSSGLYAGGNWAVVLAGGRAVAVHVVDGSWRTDTSGRVKIAILGPKPGGVAPSLPQVAAELRAPKPLVETGLWVDGKELVVKGGGAPAQATIYGAPASDLAPGRHVAVAYGRTDSTGRRTRLVVPRALTGAWHRLPTHVPPAFSPPSGTGSGSRAAGRTSP